MSRQFNCKGVVLVFGSSSRFLLEVCFQIPLLFQQPLSFPGVDRRNTRQLRLSLPLRTQAIPFSGSLVCLRKALRSRNSIGDGRSDSFFRGSSPAFLSQPIDLLPERAFHNSSTSKPRKDVCFQPSSSRSTPVCGRILFNDPANRDLLHRVLLSYGPRPTLKGFPSPLQPAPLGSCPGSSSDWDSGSSTCCLNCAALKSSSALAASSSDPCCSSLKNIFSQARVGTSPPVSS